MNKLFKVIALVCVVVSSASYPMDKDDKPQHGKRERAAQSKKTANAVVQKKKTQSTAAREGYFEVGRVWKHPLYESLYKAVDSGDLYEVRKILGYAVLNLDQIIGPDRTTLLHRAAFKGHTEILKLLLENGAKADVQLADGQTALHVACKQGHLTEMALLVKFGANNAAQTHSGQTIWDLAAACTKPHFAKSFDIFFGPNPSLIELYQVLASSNGSTYSGSRLAEVGFDIENVELKEFAAPYVLSAMNKRA